MATLPVINEPIRNVLWKIPIFGWCFSKEKHRARLQNSLRIFARQSPGVEIIDKGGCIKFNTHPLIDDSTAGAFTQQKLQGIWESGTMPYVRPDIGIGFSFKNPSPEIPGFSDRTLRIGS